MTKVIRWTEAEVSEPSDFDAIGEAAREGDENIVGGAIGYPHHWAEFAVEFPSAIELRINQGRYFVDAIVYDLDAPVTLNLQVHLPLVVNDQRYIAILARGVSETITQQRMVEIDADTEETVAEQLPKVDRRRVEFVVQQGLPSPTPLKPSVAETDCCVCYVLLTNAGISAVEPSNTHRVKTLYEVEGRVTVLEARMDLVFQRVTTLQTDLANLQARFNAYPRPEVLQQVQRDVAKTRRVLSFPDEARGYFYDPGLVMDYWDGSHASWLARVREGIRFPFAAERDERLELYDDADPTIRVYNNVLLPAWTEELRIEVDGSGGFKNISQQTHTVVTAVQRTVSRSSVEYGETVAMCENVQEWAQIGSARSGEVFAVGGDTYEKLGAITKADPTIDLSTLNATHAGQYTIEDVVQHNATVQQTGWNTIYGARQVIEHSWTETYWDYITEHFGVNGSVYAQTFLITQPMILTSIAVRVERAASEGDITMMLLEVSRTGEPLFSTVIARSTLTAAQISQGWVTFQFTPRLLVSGRRYAWATVTTGNHALAFVGNNNPDNPDANKYAQGSMFWATDGAWSQGSIGEDFCFRVYGAKFASTRTVVEFDPLTLENGMTQIQLIYSRWVPDGTSITWQVKPTAAEEWTTIGPVSGDNSGPFHGLPALTRLRAILQGTTELAPAIILDAKARGITGRHRSDMTAVTKPLTFGFNSTSIVAETVVDSFDGAHHSVAHKIIIGSTVYTPTATSIEPDFTSPSKFTRRSSFTVPSTNSARLRIDMTTDTVQKIPFVENASLFAL
jgi:hypothetical protein